MRLSKEEIVNYVDKIERQLDERNLALTINVDEVGTIQIKNLITNNSKALIGMWIYEKDSLEKFVEESVKELL